jgi:hypothetical protein
MARRKKRSRSKSIPDLSYRVGYGRPPLYSRFKKGQSGNPSGRPKGQNTWSEVICAELMLPMTVTIEGKKTTVTVLDALLADAAQRAALGSIPHIMLLMRDEYREPEPPFIMQFDENDDLV